MYLYLRLLILLLLISILFDYKQRVKHIPGKRKKIFTDLIENYYHTILYLELYEDFRLFCRRISNIKCFILISFLTVKPIP